MAEIRWTEESAQWLQDIYEYISADNPDAAEKVISTIYQKAQVLIEHPEIGYTYETYLVERCAFFSTATIE